MIIIPAKRIKPIGEIHKIKKKCREFMTDKY